MYRAASLTLVLKAALVTVVLTLSIIGTRIPARMVFWRMTPQHLLIVLARLVGIWLLKVAPSLMTWTVKQQDGVAKPQGHSQSTKDKSAGNTAAVVGKFAIACLAPRGAGIALEESGDALAGHIGMSGVLFGATVLAASTSIPELATGITSVRISGRPSLGRWWGRGRGADWWGLAATLCCWTEEK